MARGIDVVVVDPDGNVRPEGKDATYRLRRNEGRYRILSDTPGLLVLRRLLAQEEPDVTDHVADSADSAEIVAGGRVVMAGEIMAPMTLFQMVEIVAERGFQGEMHVFSAEGGWTMMALDQGALRYARSNHPDDRLGEILVRKSVLDRDWLDVLLGDVREDRRLGQVCLDRGVLDREQLYSLLGDQTREVFLRTLLVGDGSYVFTTPDPNQPPPDHTVHLSVRALLMDGIRRLDEIELYRQLIPAGDVVLRPRDDASPGGQDEEAWQLRKYFDGTKTLDEVAREAGLDEFAATRAAYFLVKGRAAEVGSRQILDEDNVRGVTEAFSAILHDVYETIDKHGGLEAARQMLGAWVEGSGYDSYLGRDVARDGTIDTETVLEAVRAAREGDPLETLHHVAHELVSFALFCAGSALPREEEIALSKDVDRRLKAIRR